MIRRHFLIGFPLLLAACDAGPVAWEGQTVAMPAPSEALGAHLPRFDRQCPASVRMWSNGSGTVFAAWWSLRADSTADIVASSSNDNGVRWAAPSRLDTLDVGKTGCDRPPPSITGDGDNVHVVYSMTAAEGPGVFLSHSMDRGRMFHSPVAVVYGKRPALTSVAANGNFVIVAYEDPNTTPTAISVAISNTMAHLFEFREVVSASDVGMAAPIVTVDGRDVTVSWMRDGGGTPTRVGRRGIIR